MAEPRYALQAANQRLRALYSYHTKEGFSPYPETLSLFLTYRCNLRCHMCWQWGDNGSTKSYEKKEVRQQLTFHEIKDLLDDVAAVASPNITLFGGEATLYKDWKRVIAYIKKKGLRCNMVTNGTTLEKHVDDLIAMGMDEIICSIDGPRDIHDVVRNFPGSFDKTMNGLTLLKSRKDALGKTKPIVNISSTITDQNYKRFDETVEVAKEAGASGITFHHLFFTGKKGYERQEQLFRQKYGVLPKDWSGFVSESLPDIDLEYLIREIHRLKSSKFKVGVAFYPSFTDEDIRNWYTKFEFRPSSYNGKCMSLWMTVYIFPDGTVRPCESMNFSSGNIKEQKFTEIWNNLRFVRYRSEVKNHGSYEICSKCTELYRF